MSRDASGNYSLFTPGNPVIFGTKILSDGWANPTLQDIAAGLTDSLSRTGKGGMGAPLVMGGFPIKQLGAATQGTDATQAVQMRDTAFNRLDPCASDATGNNYAGSSFIVAPPVNGTLFLFVADKNNTGGMTLSVNGSSAVPILIHGAPVPPGLILTGAVIGVMFLNLTWRVTNTAGIVGTVNSVQSDNLNAISVTNDFLNAVAVLNIHANVANGLVQLGSDSKVPIALLPFTDLHFIGAWNATPGVNPAPANNGDFYVIGGAGNLTIFRNTGGNVYTAQVTACAVGDYIIYNSAGTVNQPTGWYFSAGPGGTVAASSVSVVPTSATGPFAGITNVQSWLNQGDTQIRNKLPLAGGTMTGPILQPAAPGTAQALANKQYVDDTFASIPASVSSFNTRTGAVVLLSADVTAALGFIPANTTGQAFTGPVSATSFNTTGFYTGKGFTQTEYVANVTGATPLDYNNGQSQVLTLTGAFAPSVISNVQRGSILRLVLINTNLGVTWPASVAWPLGATPDLTLGPLKKAIVVLEWDGSKHLASSSAY